MSWQLISFALVLVSLALAFWWYERSHPPAKLLAVVATLAAIAALGRDAFAAVPDVKPITAIVLVSGVAFGAGPGFAVGAIAALASNILLGEGPWTPWQMLGWGLVGLIGAGLGRLTSRRMPPLALALACAVSAEVFNLILDLFTWTSSGNHTLAAFGVVLGQASVFDITHVVASFIFGLAFGSVLLRMLVRVRSRLEVNWEPDSATLCPGRARAPGSLSLPLSVLTILLAIPVIAVGVPSAARANAIHSPASAGKVSATAVTSTVRLDVSREISFLAGAQNSDGGFGAAPGQASSELYSAWAAIGLAAAGRDPLSLRRDGHTVLDALRGEASSLEGAGDLERTILALHACGVSVHVLPGGGVGGDLITRLLGYRDRDGSFGQLSNLTAFAIFALRAAGYPASSAVVRSAGLWLQEQQDSDGGFGFGTRGGGSDVDDTAAALQALVDSTGPSRPGRDRAGAARRPTSAGTGQVIARASSFLIRAQNPDGGYPQQPGGQSNAQSTAWAIQGLVAAGRNVSAVTREGSRSPLGYLESLIAPDGSVRYSRTGSQTPVWVTAQALTALAQEPFPIAPVHARASRSAARGPVASPSRAGTTTIATTRVDGLAREMGALIGTILTPMLG